MSRTKAFLQNTFTTALLQLITMMAGFILPKVMLGAYGSQVNGLVSSITQFISYFSLVEAGLRSAATYALYKPLADQDQSVVKGIMQATHQMYLRAGYIFFSLVIGLAVIYPAFIHLGQMSVYNAGLLILVLGVNGALEFFTVSKYRVLLAADQKTYVISIASIVQIVLNTLIIVLMANAGASILLLRLVALLSVLSRTVILRIYCKKRYPYLDTGKVAPLMDRLDKRWDALLLQVLGVVQNGAPVVIITVVLNDLKQVSVYSIFNMVLIGIGGILGIFISGLASSFGDVIAKNERATLQKAHREFEVAYYLIISIIYAVTLVTITPFVQVYTRNITDASYNRPLLGFFIALNGLLYNLKTPQGMLVVSAGMYRETRVQTSIQSAIAVLLGIVLAFFYGVEGVLLGSILSNLYRVIDLGYFVPRNITMTKVISTYRLMLRTLIGVAIVYGLSLSWFTFDGHTYGAWALYALQVSALALGVCLSINLAVDFKVFKSIFKRLSRLV